MQPSPARLVQVLLEDETISAAAVKCRDGTVYTGRAHWECCMKASQAGMEWNDYEDLGYTTNEGRFVTRDQAELIALKAKQLKPEISDPCMLHASDFEWME